MAAVLGAGEHAALSHRSVAGFWRASRWRETAVHVVSTTRRQLDAAGWDVTRVRS
jgi:hypothetical protein